MKLRLNLVLATTTVLACSCTGEKVDEQPNVLMIILDDAGYNDFGFMGCPDIETPNIDALASDGVILTDGHVSASVSGPSRAGMLSGRYQQRNGYECNLEQGFGLDPELNTVGDVFQENGYQTIAIGKWHQGDMEYHHPNERGFDEFYGFLTGSRSYFANEQHDAPGAEHTMLQHNKKQITPTKYMTYQLGERAEQYIAESGDQPFLMYLAFNAVHTPLEATKEDLARFEGHPRQMLAAMTYAVDKAIGGVVAQLKESGKYDNTLIYFISDNGGAHNNQSRNTPLKGWKGNKFEGGHRVPFFVVYGDKLQKGTKYDGLCSSLDMFATSIAAAGIDYKCEKYPLDGVDILPYLRGEKDGEPHDILFWRKNNQKAVRQGDYKLIRVDKLDKQCLYNIAEDLQESNDLSESNPEKAAEMLTLLRSWESELVNPVLWDEGEWEAVNIEIHRALMNNEKNTVYTPSQYRNKMRNAKKAK